MKAMIRNVDDHGVKYDALAFVCPACGDDLHMLAVNTDQKSPSWTWDDNLDAPTLSPSILTRWGNEPNVHVCHSFLKAGVFEYLSDCTHAFAGQNVPMGELPEWFTTETNRRD